jgi:type I restriction enzyme S subunit
MSTIPAGYKQTEAGVIPGDWTEIDLSHFCVLQRGFDITEKTTVAGLIPVYSSSGLAYFHNKAMVFPPGVVTGRKGILGKVFLINEPFWPHDTTLWVKDFNGNLPAYVALVLQNFHLERLDAATSVPTLNRNNLAGHLVAIPSTKAEQEAIAAALSDADTLIKSLEQLVTKKRYLKQGAMQELLTGQRRLPGFSGDWLTKRLGELFTFSGGYSASRDQLSTEGHCYLHYGDIHKSSKTFIDVRTEYQDIPKLDIPLRAASSSSLLEDGDVVFVDASEDNEGTSKHIVVVNKENKPFISGLHTIVAKEKSTEVSHEYRRYCFQTYAVRQQFLFYAVGTKVSGISKTNIVKIILPVPSIPEQNAIASILSDMDTEIVELEAQLAKARTIKQGMMHQLLTGRIRLI